MGDSLSGPLPLEKLAAKQAHHLLGTDSGYGVEAAVRGDGALGDKAVEKLVTAPMDNLYRAVIE